MAIAKKITIHDVALAAGVSVSTVSLVLSGKGRISTATGERVNAAIEQLGFVRNRQASALRGGQSGVIGLIVRDLSAQFYAELTAGLTEALEAQGRMVFLLHGGQDGEQLAQRFAMLLNQGVDGVVIAGAAGSSDDLRVMAEEKGIPVVFASRASYLDDADTVRPDNMRGCATVDRASDSSWSSAHRMVGWTEFFINARGTCRRLLRDVAEIWFTVSQRLGDGVRVQPEAYCRGNWRITAA